MRCLADDGFSYREIIFPITLHLLNDPFSFLCVFPCPIHPHLTAAALHQHAEGESPAAPSRFPPPCFVVAGGKGDVPGVHKKKSKNLPHTPCEKKNNNNNTTAAAFSFSIV